MTPQCRRGLAAAIEAALVLPVFLLFVGGAEEASPEGGELDLGIFVAELSDTYEASPDSEDDEPSEPPMQEPVVDSEAPESPPTPDAEPTEGASAEAAAEPEEPESPSEEILDPAAEPPRPEQRLETSRSWAQKVALEIHLDTQTIEAEWMEQLAGYYVLHASSTKIHVASDGYCREASVDDAGPLKLSLPPERWPSTLENAARTYLSSGHRASADLYLQPAWESRIVALARMAELEGRKPRPNQGLQVTLGGRLDSRGRLELFLQSSQLVYRTDMIAEAVQ